MKDLKSVAVILVLLAVLIYGTVAHGWFQGANWRAKANRTAPAYLPARR